MKTSKKNDEALRHSKRPLHRVGGRGRGGHYIDDFCSPKCPYIIQPCHGSSSMSTGAKQIHEYPWVSQIFSPVRRSSAAEMFRSRPWVETS